MGRGASLAPASVFSLSLLALHKCGDHLSFQRCLREDLGRGSGAWVSCCEVCMALVCSRTPAPGQGGHWFRDLKQGRRKCPMPGKDLFCPVVRPISSVCVYTWKSSLPFSFPMFLRPAPPPTVSSGPLRPVPPGHSHTGEDLSSVGARLPGWQVGPQPAPWDSPAPCSLTHRRLRLPKRKTPKV